MHKLVTLSFATVVAAGCASGGQANDSSDEVIPGTGVELVVVNETRSTMTASVQWRGGRAIRLGEVRPSSEETFHARIGGVDVRVTFSDVARGRGSGATSDYVQVSRGDRLEWALRFDGTVFYRRLPPN